MPARDLYISPWFTKARGLVEARQAAWFILSAEYGLVHPNVVIAPYERTLNRMSAADRRSWGERVSTQLREALPNSPRVVVLAGLRYREPIWATLVALAASVEVPMEGLTIGRQLRWLGQQRGT